jgi:hypothetical protein
MIRYIIIAGLVLLCNSILAASYTSQGSGDWKTSGNWDNGVPPLNGNNVDITISSGHAITLTDDITFNNNCSLTVEGDLTIDGTFTVNNNLDISVTGTLTITGAFSANNNADVIVNGTGTMDVEDDMSFGNGADITVNGSLTVDGNLTGNNTDLLGSGALNVGGTMSGVDDTGFSGTLPVELLFFDAVQVGNSILLEWSTAAEINNDYFTIERSENGLEFREISRVPGSGTTEQPVDYHYMDTRPLPGLSYYRLKQTDFDGTSETFRMVAVQYSGIAEQELNVFPNPLAGDVLRIEAQNFLPGKEATVTVTDLSGRMLIRRQYEVKTSGVFRAELDALGQLPPGIYLLDLVGTQDRITRRFIKQ